MKDLKSIVIIEKMTMLGLYETAYIRFSDHLYVWLIERFYDI